MVFLTRRRNTRVLSCRMRFIRGEAKSISISFNKTLIAAPAQASIALQGLKERLYTTKSHWNYAKRCLCCLRCLVGFGDRTSKVHEIIVEMCSSRSFSQLTAPLGRLDVDGRADGAESDVRPDNLTACIQLQEQIGKSWETGIIRIGN